MSHANEQHLRRLAARLRREATIPSTWQNARLNLGPTNKKSLIPLCQHQTIIAYALSRAAKNLHNVFGVCTILRVRPQSVPLRQQEHLTVRRLRCASSVKCDSVTLVT